MFGMEPFKKMPNMMEFFNDEFFKPSNFNSANVFCTDVRETEKEYIIETELPGFNKEDIAIDISSDALTIKAERKSENKTEKDGTYIRRERSYSSYQRSFVLDGIDSDKISANYENGILTITMPKTEIQPPPSRRLEIK